MRAPEIFRVGDDRLLCDRWQARTRTVVLRPSDPARPPHPTAIEAVLDTLRARGVERVLTAALDETGIEPFTAAGFAPHETLCVLRHDLAGTTPSTTIRTRRASRRRDLHAAACVDERAFATGTTVDDGGLTTILDATPDQRFRLVATPEKPSETVAYGIFGIAGTTGYLQRLAVDPAWRRKGMGRALVCDALTWFRRHHARSALVNTQTTNEAARRLYLDTGFSPTSERLAVGVWTRTPSP